MTEGSTRVAGKCEGERTSLSQLPSRYRRVLLGVALFLTAFPLDASAWWDSAWGRRRKLTFNNSGQPSNLTNFPVLVVLNAARIDYTKTQNAGQDLRFVDANDQVLLNHEIELWNEAGTSHVWVRVPQIDASSTTDFIWMYYDNPTAAAPPPEAAQQIWDSSFQMVQHLNEQCPPSCTGGAHTDSTVNGNDSSAITVTAQGTAAGRIDGADQYVLGDFVRVPDDPTLDAGATESLLVEAWVQPADDTNWKHIVSKEWDGTAGQGGFEFSMPDSRVRFAVNDGAGTTCDAFSGGGTITAGSVYYIVGRYDRSTNACQVFLNGTITVGATNAVGSLANPQPLGIGREEDGTPAFSFNGVIDEVRLSKWSGGTPRSNDWIRAQWESMRSGSTFINYGAQSGQVTLRSIGTAANYTAGNVTATIGSRIVNGSSTTWFSSNRGRGDRITINGNNYTVLSVDSNTQITLTSAAIASYSGTNYSIARKFLTLQDWEECIDGPPLGPGICEGPPTASLVADDRTEIGIVYEDSVFPVASSTTIDGSTTDANHTITLTADGVNRHYGLPGTGVLINNAGGFTAIVVQDDYVTVEWLEIQGGTNDGIMVDAVAGAGANEIVLRNLLIHNVCCGGSSSSIEIRDANTVADLYNNIIHSGRQGVAIGPVLMNPASRIRLFNNTFYNHTINGIWADNTNTHPTVFIRNNISVGNGSPDYDVNTPNGASSNNLSEDGSQPGGAPVVSTIANVKFVNAAGGDLHIQATSTAENAGTDLSSVLSVDIDAKTRITAWEIGADDTTATTAVTLSSFAAAARDAAVELSWTTASELQNLGFHVYRSESEQGPYARITSSLIPGLGSSATGRSYSYVDAGLLNGRTHFYKLEDVETTGHTEMHGPVSATPVAAPTGGGIGSDSGASGTVYGAPSSVHLREVERSAKHVVLELLTPGFYASLAEGGRVNLSIPGFASLSRPGELSLPARRALVEATAGRKVRLASVVASDVVRFPGLRPTVEGVPELEVGEDGSVLPSRRAVRARRTLRGIFPADLARLGGSVFQGETKKAELLLLPLRYDGRTGQLELSRRLVVRLEFSGTETNERSLGGTRGRQARERKTAGTSGVVAQILVKERGLYRVNYEEVFAASLRRRSGISTTSLKLSRQGESVAFHVAPDRRTFGPGSSLYFLSEGEKLNPYGDAVYELETNQAGLSMPVEAVSSSSSGVVTEHFQTLEREENKYYQAGLLDAPDLWQWHVVVSPEVKSYSFTVDHLSLSSSSAHLKVDLQGASDFEGVVDHHVRVSVNGSVVGEGSWDGKLPKTLELEVGAGLLREGENTLEIEDVGDTGAVYSMVFLNRFSVSYPRTLVATGGKLEGRFAFSGQAEVQGLSASSVLLDTTETPRWLVGASTTPAGLVFSVQAGRSYLASSAPLRPAVRVPQTSTLKSTTNRADYLLLGPREFLPAAQPLLDFRESQGLATRAVSLEEVYEQFGHGEVSPEAIKGFLEFAYQSWASPSPRYVLLLGDASYDPKDYLKTGVLNRLPGFPTRTSFLWTVSDPAYASVNGEDLIPDIAIGRLPAGSVAEAQVLMQKVLAFENGGGDFQGRAVLVADNADLAGNFEQDADEITAGVLASRRPQKIYYSQLGSSTRAAIRDAFDQGASLVSYVGHGGTVVWASENVFNFLDVATLQPQPQQPLLLTMNCLNGFFHFPPLNSLSEAFLKAEGKGAIGAFSPSGLSINEAAHLYHKALLGEILSGRHERMGDAVLAAQDAYAQTGAFPELLSIYHLFGDPALRIR